MKQIVLYVLICFGLNVFAQYPELDEHTSVGGAGEWFNQSGQVTMGVEGGTVLCYNIASSYTDDDTYIWESSDYGTQFTDDGLDSVYFAVNLTMDIRSNGDLFYMGYFDGGTWTDFLIPYRLVAVWTTFYVWVPNTTTKFRYRLYTYGNGTKTSKFVHINQTVINSASNVLPIELVLFDGRDYGDFNRIEWVTASEINNDHFLLERSVNGTNWDQISIINGGGNSNQFIDYYYDDYFGSEELYYYRLTQYDYDGKYEVFDIIVVDSRSELCDKNLIKIVNSFGQIVNEDYRGVKIYVYDDGTIVKKF